MLPESVAVAFMIVATVAVFALCCLHIARAAFVEQPARTDVRLALFWGLAFAATIVGCLVLTDLYDTASAAVFAVAFCLVALITGRILDRSWRTAENAEARSLEELRELVNRYRESESSVEARCARAAREHDLTRREEDMLRLIMEGRTQPEIARELFVSRDTVKTHVRNLYRKMGVSSKGELVETLTATQ